MDILNQLIDLTQTILHIPDNFIDSVLERESFSSTDVGNLIAIPHPNEDFLNQSIVTIGILDKPILWNTENVQLIFLISISHNDNSNIESFYKWLSTLIGNKEQVKNIIQKKTFESLFEKF